MIWFTSDLHLGDQRLYLYARDLCFKDNKEFERTLFKHWNEQVKSEDTVYVLGDVSFDESCYKIKYLNGKKVLIRGNYDRDDMTAKDGVTKILPTIFDEIYDDKLLELDGNLLYLNHFPDKCVSEHFNVTGHIHGLWRVQRNMINVGIDAWNYYLINQERLMFFKNAIDKHYDLNVFAGELQCNRTKASRQADNMDV